MLADDKGLISKYGKGEHMQTHRKGNRRGKFGKLGLSVLGAIVFTASHAWAAPFTGATSSFFTSAPVAGSDGTFSHFLSTFTIHGYFTTFGALVCHGVQTSIEFVEEPTGACGAEEFEIRATNKYSCQYEGAEDIFYSTGTSTGCLPLSCYDANFVLQVGCSVSYTESVTATGGSGIAEGSSGSWTASGTGTYTQVEPAELEGFYFYAGTIRAEIQGDFELADGSVPPDGANLGIPSSGTNVSGIGLISGWSCLGGELAVEFSDAEGVIGTVPVLQGSERLDTESVCGDVNNGFSATYNWSRLGAGERTARLIRNGEEVDSSTFMVTAFDDDFLPNAEGMCTIPNFPDMGTNATFVWETSQQSLVLESVN